MLHGTKFKSVGTMLPMDQRSDLSDYLGDKSLIVLRNGKPVDILQNNVRVSRGKWKAKRKTLNATRKGN